MRTSIPPILALLPLLGCAEGGSEERPRSEVALAASNHFFGMIGQFEFAGFPITPAEMIPFGGTLTMRDDSSYLIGGDASLTDSYALTNFGALALLVRQQAGPTLLLRGAWDNIGNSQNTFITDRVGTRIGMYVGTKVSPGPADDAELAAFAAASPEWQLFAMTVLFADPAAAQTKENVGHAITGVIGLTANGSELTVAGTGSDSRLPGSGTPIAGRLTSVAAEANPLRLSVDFGSGGSTLRRNFIAGGSDEIVFGADRNTAQGGTALMAMIRVRQTELRVADLAGRYIVGMWSLFLNPAASGLDSALGILTIDTGNRFELGATDHNGQNFVWTGSYAIPTPNTGTTPTTDPDGTLILTLDDTGEVWRAAVDEDANTIVILDNIVEARPNNQSEFNFIMAVRENN